MPPPDQFRYDGFAIDAATSVVTCRYSTATHGFTERFWFTSAGSSDDPGAWDDPAVRAAVRILYLLAGVSYYKTAAPRRIDLGDLASTPAERTFLETYYVSGLGEFAHRNGIDLHDVTVSGPDATPAPARYEPEPGRPLIPFGGGIDSIVTVEGLAADNPGAALCVVHPPADRFDAIEDAAAVSGLPVVHIGRAIDPLVRRSDELGFLNGHVPVTAVITAAAVVAAVLDRRDAVVLSNEWSASAPTLVAADGRPVNHQWSKGEEFERAFGELVHGAVGPGLAVFSYLRPRSELWVAQQFAGLDRYHRAFRSCNRAFHQDPARRLDHWCGRCDKCCFVDLVLAPFMDRSELAAVFGGDEPLENPANTERFRTLIGLGPGVKPFECVGDTDECRVALLLASQRADRTATTLLHALRRELAAATPAAGPDAAVLLEPRGAHHIPDRYAPADLLVRAR